MAPLRMVEKHSDWGSYAVFWENSGLLATHHLLTAIFGIVKLFSSVGKIAWRKLINQQQARNMNGPQGLQVDSPDLLDILILNMKYVALFWNHAKYRDISHLSATSDFNLEHLAWYLCWSSRYRSSTVLMAAHTKCHYQACGCSWIHFPSARGFCILSRWRACPVQRTFVDSKRDNLRFLLVKLQSLQHLLYLPVALRWQSSLLES